LFLKAENKIVGKREVWEEEESPLGNGTGGGRLSLN
jgi:hypothetical protein